MLEAADSAMVSFGVTKTDGAFRLRRVPPGDYLLQVTFVGMEPYSESLTVGDQPVDVGAISLKDDIGELDELVISANHIPMLIHADTIKYNADAFHVQPNASVEELLKRLPGVEVARDGSIKAQGEKVEQVLVDGKEFFGSDPTIATKNLPAEAVEQVEVYDKQSDMAEFTGIEDGEESKTINLSIKEDHKQGYFGNVSGGYGRDVHDNRYQGKASINRFSPSTQLSFLGNLNNVNQQGYSMGDYMSFGGGTFSMSSGGVVSIGIPGVGGNKEGFTTTASAGLNLNHDFHEKTSLRSSYFYNASDNEQDRLVRQEQLSGSVLSSRSLQHALQDQLTQNHRLNLNLQHKMADGHDLRLRTKVFATTTGLDNLSTQATRDVDQILRNSNATTYQNDGEEWGGEGTLTYRKRLSDHGRALVAELRANLKDGNLTGDLDALNTIYDEFGNILTTEEIAQLQRQLSTTFSRRAKISLTEPLGKKSYLQFQGNREQTTEDQRKRIYDKEGDSLIRSDSLSSALKHTYTYNRASMTLHVKRNRQMFNLGVQVQGAQLGGDLWKDGVRIDQQFVNVLPTAMYRYSFQSGPSLELSYSASTREPSMRELQPFEDNSDPLNIYIGNPALRPEYRHTTGLRFMYFDAFSFTNVFATLRTQFTKNQIVRSRTIDEGFRQQITSVNGGNGWSISGNTSFETPVRPLGIKVRLSNETMLNRGLEYVNDLENQTKLLRNTVGLRLENRNKDLIDAVIGTRYSFNVNRYSLNPERSQNYLNRTFYGEVTYNLNQAWRITTSLDYRLYAEDVFGSGQDVALLRAELSRMLFQNRAELKLSGNDLLDNNRGISYTNTNSYFQETHVNTLGRYFMLSFVYNLSGVQRQGPLIQVIDH